MIIGGQMVRFSVLEVVRTVEVQTSDLTENSVRYDKSHSRVHEGTSHLTIGNAKHDRNISTKRDKSYRKIK